MARDPGSLWSPLVENGRQGSYAKTQFIVHSTGDRGTAAAIFNYFNRANVVVESTFVVGRGPEDPTRQLLDSSSGADANLGANQRAISVEVVGTADDDYTEWQVQEIIRLGRWARATHPIEARICPAHNESGFGWHVMFGSPGPWTPVAKSCPGNLRIQRLRERVFPAIFNNTTSPATPAQEDTGMAVIKSPNRRAALISPGYFRELNDEEAANSGVFGQMVSGNDRQYDLWVSMATSGQTVLDMPIPRSEKAGGGVTTLRTQAHWEDYNHRTVTPEAVAKVVGTPQIDAEALASQVIAALDGKVGLTGEDVEAALRNVLREGTGDPATRLAA